MLKVIDQGADDTTNAVSIRAFFQKVANVAVTTKTKDATVIQTRHRIPEETLTEGQTLVYQVPIPEPLRFLEPRETETRKMHALEEYGLMHVKLYEDIARNGHIATTYAYPVKIEGRYVMDPSPIPKFDNPKMHRSEALQLFGAGREKRIYALPPHTEVVSLDFEDHPFEIQRFDKPCALCGANHVYLDEVVLDDRGGRMFVCSDTDYCEDRRAAGHVGELGVANLEAAAMSDAPLLKVRDLSKCYGARIGCRDVSFDLYPGEVLAIVGESGSGKTTLLSCISTRLMPTTGVVEYRMRDGELRDLARMSEAERRFLMRTDWGFVHQNPPTACAWRSRPAPMSASG